MCYAKQEVCYVWVTRELREGIGLKRRPCKALRVLLRVLRVFLLD